MTLIVRFNELANAIARVCLSPIGWLPGWVSATVVGIVTGVIMLLTFKYTSNQSAIKATRDQIKANLFALSLFRDSLLVGFRIQGSLLLRAGQLLLHSLVPVVVMTLPMILLLGQLGLWYQARPLHLGEEAVVTAELNATPMDTLRRTTLETTSAVEQRVGPVRVPSRNVVCWKIVAKENRLNTLIVNVDGERISKELAVGSGYMPVSQIRPARTFADVLLHPREPPPSETSKVRSIEVTFPKRDSLLSGTDHWLIYWFAISMLTAIVVKPLFRVNL